MSGICGIVHLDGAPADRGLLAQLTDRLKFRGPDRQDVWAKGSAGLGHTLLITTFESEHERQPCSLDGRVWITADARIDGWGNLKRKLEAAGRHVHEGVTDAGLILHAYHVWGERCVEHLIGDFAFAIWDGKRQALFCARDHFGVKPFYYAKVGNAFVFSNTLNCVRRYPGVTERLNDLAVADFLLFDGNQDPATTFFEGVQRLPPAHCLKVAGGNLAVPRYWRLPAESELLRLKPPETVERFRELLGVAVADRLRTDRVGVSMSGGLDSASIAAVALEKLSRQSKAFEVRAHTIVYDRLIPDRERHFSGLVARHLGIPIEYLVADDYGLYERWDRPELQRPEPTHEPQLAIASDHLRQCAARSRVLLTGWDGDAILNEPPLAHFARLRDEGRYVRLAEDIGHVLWIKRNNLFKSLVLRGKRLAGRSGRLEESDYPSWINPEFDKRLALPERWRLGMIDPGFLHPTHPHAYRKLTTDHTWVYLFEENDPGVTSIPVEVRHPLMDLRLVDFLLNIPAVPWAVEKHLLRVSMKGTLPAEVLRRPKSRLAGLPYLEHLKRSSTLPVDSVAPPEELGYYINFDKAPRAQAGDGSWGAWTNMRPVTLKLWLQDPQLRSSFSVKENRNEEHP